LWRWGKDAAEEGLTATRARRLPGAAFEFFGKLHQRGVTLAKQAVCGIALNLLEYRSRRVRTRIGAQAPLE
jgi:hypothetical protein